MMKQKRWIIPAAIAALVVIVLFLPIDIPYSINVPGTVLCANEWVLTINRDGGLASFRVDRGSGVTSNYSVMQVNRGDAVRFSLDSAIAMGRTVAQGAVVGRVQSSDLVRDVETLRGELKKAEALLAVTSTGEKESMIAEAKQEVERTKKEAEALRLMLAREKKLLEKGIIAQQQFELTESKTNVAEIGVGTATARLRSMTTGQKDENVRYVRAEIEALRAQISVFEQRLNAQTITTPVAGLITHVAATDTMLVVSDTSSYIVLLPIPIRERDAVASGQFVRLIAAEYDSIPDAQIRTIDRTIRALNGQHVVLATAVLRFAPRDFIHGLTAHGTIRSASIPIAAYVWKKLHSALR